MLELQDLLSPLGYDLSPNYFRSEQQFEAETIHLFRSARTVGVDGVYVVQASSTRSTSTLPARPVVFVATAKTEEQAREIHRSMWNLGSAPFLLIVLPNQIRVYTAFEYSPTLDHPGRKPETERGLFHVYDDRLNVVRQLAHFSADAIDTGQIWESPDYKRVDSRMRVDTRLLDNLRQLDKTLQQDMGLDSDIAHALIGKYVYIRYLRGCDLES